MNITHLALRRLLLFVALALLLAPATAMAEKHFGGLTFIGDREGICIQVAGDCRGEDIQFDLSTCDANQVTKKKYQERMPFTLLVPAGTHELVIKKDNQVILQDTITIIEEQVTEYTLPAK